MTHTEAIETQVVERFLLGELSMTEQDELAAHYFECPDCAHSVRTGALFIGAMKEDLLSNPEAERPVVVRWWNTDWAGWGKYRLPLAVPVALMAIVVYQNVSTLPAYRRSSSPQAVEFFSVGTIGSRAAGQSIIAPPEGRPFLLLVDIPPGETTSRYHCEVLAANSHRVASIEIPGSQAERTVPLLIPAGTFKHGVYTLRLSESAGASDHEIGSYTLDLK